MAHPSGKRSARILWVTTAVFLILELIAVHVIKGYERQQVINAWLLDSGVVFLLASATAIVGALAGLSACFSDRSLGLLALNFTLFAFVVSGFSTVVITAQSLRRNRHIAELDAKNPYWRAGSTGPPPSLLEENEIAPEIRELRRQRRFKSASELVKDLDVPNDKTGIDARFCKLQELLSHDLWFDKNDAASLRRMRASGTPEKRVLAALLLARAFPGEERMGPYALRALSFTEPGPGCERSLADLSVEALERSREPLEPKLKAALTQLFSRGSNDPNRLEARSGLALVLWRSGDRSQAVFKTLLVHVIDRTPWNFVSGEKLRSIGVADEGRDRAQFLEQAARYAVAPGDPSGSCLAAYLWVWEKRGARMNPRLLRVALSNECWVEVRRAFLTWSQAPAPVLDKMQHDIEVELLRGPGETAAEGSLGQTDALRAGYLLARSNRLDANVLSTLIEFGKSRTLMKSAILECDSQVDVLQLASAFARRCQTGAEDFDSRCVPYWSGPAECGFEAVYEAAAKSRNAAARAMGTSALSELKSKNCEAEP